MKYQPSDQELAELESFKANERLHYFLTRAIESEEVWGLSNPSGWVMKKNNDHNILPIWPYSQLATNCAIDKWKDYAANAVSLEHFVYKLLPVMIEQNIKAEVLPTKTHPGDLVDARELASLLEGMLESGEYYMEG